MHDVDVVVLDDEQHILSAVQRTLREGLGCTVATTTDPHEALDWLVTRHAKVLVTDFRMPVMDGVQVLCAARDIAPDTLRILLTAQADKENIVDAINLGKIFRYVEKPWGNESFCRLVQEAIQIFVAAQHRHKAIRDADAERRTLLGVVEAAGAIQRSVLPPAKLDVHGAQAACSYSIAEHATGDYVDAFVTAGGKTVLLVGDVSGHGLDAALFVFTARALLRSGLMEGESLSTVLARTNRLLCRDMCDGRFFTLFAALYDGAASTFTYVNAGHNAPLLVTEHGVTELQRTALPLGITEQAEFDHAITLPLAAEQTLFAFTDGVTEARNEARELFGLDRLIDLLRDEAARPPLELLARVRRATLEFAPTALQEDDMTMLAFRPTPAVVPV